MKKYLQTAAVGIVVIFSVIIASLPAAEGAPVRLGIDTIDEHLQLFAGKRVGLITNQTGVNSKLESTVDVLYEKTNLTAIFSPEHGLRGQVEAGASVGTGMDSKTGLPVYSLYGDTKKPTPAMLQNIDILCFDMQDIGTRFYTYMSTMALAMESAKENNIQFVVLDRPNPIGGTVVEGPVLKAGLESFIGMYPIPIRHGLTIGELALLMNDHFGIGCNLQVIKMKEWQRKMHWQDTGLHWVMTSPNIPTPDSGLVYPGTGLSGATNISEGVGTTRPFELIGASWLNGQAVAERLNQANLPGVHFRPVGFTPRFGEHSGVGQNGVQIHITDRYVYQSVRTAAMVLAVMRQFSPDRFAYDSERLFDIHIGESDLRLGIAPLTDLMDRWQREATLFQSQSRQFYLYP